MPTLLLLATLLTTLDPAGQAPAAVPAPPAGACAAVDELPAAGPCEGAGPLCAARDRVRTVCELRDAVRSRYVFLDAKRTLLSRPLDGSAHLEACAAGERAIGREDDPLRFYDRVRRCVAAFEDGHLIVSAPVRLPQVALGVGFRRAGGRIVVGWRERSLGELAGAEAVEALPPGAELVAIDGRPAAAAAEELALHVAASSPEARLERAVEALGRRDFAFPARRSAALTVVAGGVRRTVEVPWWTSPGASRHPLAGAWARQTGIGETDRLAWFEEAARPRPGAAVDGAPAWAPVLPPAAAAALREYVDENGRVAVRVGAVARAGRDVCYLQILTFHTETLAASGRRRPFAEVIDEAVRDCGARGLDLVLDLRRNEGGYLDHSTAVAEALAPPGTAQPGAALVLRATERNEAVYRERTGAAAGGPARDPLEPGHVLEAIGAARREGRPFTPAFVGGPLRPRPAVGGYSGRVVALTGPACMSACDRLAALLHASGRAVLVGGPTEGAGGSQQETAGVPARWTDGARQLTVSIPNAAFGVPRSAGAPVLPALAAPAGAPLPRGRTAGMRAGELPFETFFDLFLIENRPVEPDVRYDARVEDVTAAGRGWLEQVDAILFGAPALAPVAARPYGTTRSAPRSPPALG
jgi:hypothetical protein